MRTAVAGFLSDNGYKVHTAPSGEVLFEKKLHLTADLAVLDIALPGISGIEITRRLKEDGFEGPVIALTARDTIDDKLYGLSSGMNDYIVKPFDLRELQARIDAQLRTRGLMHGMSTVSTSRFRIEPKRHKFFMDDKPVKLTLVEFRIMQILMQHNQTTVNTQDIIDAAWGEDNPTISPPTRIHISNLRNKINDKSLTIIQTIPGVGYMLND
jgi:DNA-binding response OmpR family regulator